MDDLKFYFSVFLRRLPWFLVVSTIITAVAVIVAISMPPAYVSQARLVVRGPEIIIDQATVDTPALEYLQIIEQRLMTRDNLLDIARRYNALPNVRDMSPDQIVRAMRARTSLATQSGRGQATTMSVAFEAGSSQIASEVANAYVTIMQEVDAEFRRGRSGNTVTFFAQAVASHEAELKALSEKIITFKQGNSDALPETLDFRMTRRSEMREAIVAADRDITRLKGQRERILQLFEATGNLVVGGGNPNRLSPDQQELQAKQTELENALLVFSETNPRVVLLRRQIEQLQTKIANTVASTNTDGDIGGPDVNRAINVEVQIAEIDENIDLLEEQRARLQEELAVVNETIERTAEVTISLEEMEREYARVNTQLDQAEAELSRAEAGDMVVANARGQRIEVIEQPTRPNEPTKPNRMVIAGGGGVLGVLAGLGLVVLMELLNGSVRRPEDLVARFGISPLVTIPYIRTRRQLVLQRGLKLATIMVILVGIPAAIYAMHVYYLPVDVVADRVMDRLGVRW